MDCLAKVEPEYLDLSGNELEEVPAALNSSGFENLKHLNLAQNKIRSLVSNNFGSMNLLKDLNISHNYLTDLPTKMAPGLSIDVSYNKLTDMRSLFGLAYTKAIVRGNLILCECNSSTVLKMYQILRTTGGLERIECLLHDKDAPKPISAQCHTEIDKAEEPEDINKILLKGSFIVGTIVSVFLIVLKICRRVEIDII